MQAPASRLLRLRAFEILIFVVLAVLFAMCITAAPLIAEDRAGPSRRRALAAAGP